MTCPTCGQAATGAERFCTNCGADLAATVPPGPPLANATAAPALAPQSTTPTADLRGVRGWLLLFCIWITIIDLLQSLFPLVAVIVAGYFRLNWTVPLWLGLVVYGVVTGIQLWRARSSALIMLRV